MAAASALGDMLVGYDIGVISGAILFIQKEFLLSARMQEIVVSSVLLGSLAGAAVGGVVADRLGRRKLLIGAALVFGLGAIGAALAPDTAWLIVARIIAGIAIGIASFVAPLYISEIAPVAIRGKLVSINQVAITTGIVISYLIDYAFAGSQAWRWMFAVAAVPASAFGIGLFFIPDSPRCLAGIGNADRARSVLRTIRNPEQVAGELADIHASLGQQKAEVQTVQSGPAAGDDCWDRSGNRAANHRHKHCDLLRSDDLQIRRLISSSAAILASVGVGVVNVALTVVAMRLIDRAGRRPLLLISLGGMALSLAVLGAAFSLPQFKDVLGWVSIGSLMTYVGSFAVGLGPVFWLILSEIYPLRIRGRAMSVGTAANCSVHGALHSSWWPKPEEKPWNKLKRICGPASIRVFCERLNENHTSTPHACRCSVVLHPLRDKETVRFAFKANRKNVMMRPAAPAAIGTAESPDLHRDHGGNHKQRRSSFKAEWMVFQFRLAHPFELTKC